jgi:hypothetical protein
MAAKFTDSQYSDTTAPSGGELYHLQFSLQAASPETYGYTLVQEEKGHNLLSLLFFLGAYYQVDYALFLQR